jgi:hypothetical protein
MPKGLFDRTETSIFPSLKQFKSLEINPAKTSIATNILNKEKMTFCSRDEIWKHIQVKVPSTGRSNHRNGQRLRWMPPRTSLIIKGVKSATIKIHNLFKDQMISTFGHLRWLTIPSIGTLICLWLIFAKSDFELEYVEWRRDRKVCSLIKCGLSIAVHSLMATLD